MSRCSSVDRKLWPQDLSENRVGVEPGLRMAHNPAVLGSPTVEMDNQQEAPRDSRPLALNLRLNSLTGPVTLASIQVSQCKEFVKVCGMSGCRSLSSGWVKG